MHSIIAISTLAAIASAHLPRHNSLHDNAHSRLMRRQTANATNTSPSSSSGLLSGQGDGTYYFDVNGVGVCGKTALKVAQYAENKGYALCESATDPKQLETYKNNKIVALANKLLQGADREKYCGHEVEIEVGGKKQEGPFIIWDGCEACNGNGNVDGMGTGMGGVDFSDTAFHDIFGDSGCTQGRMTDAVKWTITDKVYNPDGTPNDSASSSSSDSTTPDSSVPSASDTSASNSPSSSASVPSASGSSDVSTPASSASQTDPTGSQPAPVVNAKATASDTSSAAKSTPSSSDSDSEEQCEEYEPADDSSDSESTAPSSSSAAPTPGKSPLSNTSSSGNTTTDATSDLKGDCKAGEWRCSSNKKDIQFCTTQDGKTLDWLTMGTCKKALDHCDTDVPVCKAGWDESKATNGTQSATKKDSN